MEPIRILIADDEHMIRTVLSRIFADPRYEVYMAADGVEALEMARELKPDVVLLDINMPRLDGRDVLARLQADERMRDTMTVFLTARVSHLDRLLGLELGAEDYFEKPFDPLMLRRRIDRLVQKRRSVN